MIDSITFLILIGVSWIILLVITSNKWINLTNPEVGLGFLMYRVQTFNAVLDRLARISKTLWRIIFDIGLLFCLGFLFTSFIMFSVNFVKYLELLAISAHFLPNPPNPNTIQTVPFVPAIPGISISFDTLPYFFIAIGIAAALHELAHGVAARAENIDLKSTGLLFFLFFFGAFVEPEEKSLKKSNPRSRLRVYAAGAFTNIVLVFLLLILLTPLFFNFVMTPFFSTTTGGALIIEVCPAPITDCAANGTLHVNNVITQAQYQNGTTVQINSDVAFSIFASQTKSNETIYLSILDQSNPVKIITGPYPSDSSRGLIGVVVASYYAPVYSFLPLELPYWYLRTLAITMDLSLVLALVNLLPVPPLDGDKIVTEIIQFFSKENSKKWIKRVRIITLVVILGNLVLTFLINGWTPV